MQVTTTPPGGEGLGVRSSQSASAEMGQRALPDFGSRIGGFEIDMSKTDTTGAQPVITRELHDMALMDEMLARHNLDAQQRILDWLDGNYQSRRSAQEISGGK